MFKKQIFDVSFSGRWMNRFYSLNDGMCIPIKDYRETKFSLWWLWNLTSNRGNDGHITVWCIAARSRGTETSPTLYILLIIYTCSVINDMSTILIENRMKLDRHSCQIWYLLEIKLLLLLILLLLKPAHLPVKSMGEKSSSIKVPARLKHFSDPWVAHYTLSSLLAK